MAETQRVMVTITDSQASRLARVIEDTGLSKSAVMSLALSEWLTGWEHRHHGDESMSDEPVERG